MSAHVLVVEPDEAIAGVIALALSDEGYRVTGAGTLDDALTLLAARDHRTVDVVITALENPLSVDPANVLERLRQCTCAPVILRVPTSMPGDADQEIEGATVMREPLDLQEVMDCVVALRPPMRRSPLPRS